jgi:DNA-binding transcriptional LysR family regulator
VIEQGNIAQASRVNGIAASAISQCIFDLEDQNGVPLIHRLRDGIEPYSGGRISQGELDCHW